MPIDVQNLLGPDGAIARRMGGDYEPRPQQVEMASAVDRALDGGGTLAVEAGTGVGKSFAYLLPAIRRIVEHNERVVISTNTISLQEQLIDKDIPLLRAVLDDEFSAVLVKGRSNYVSLRRLQLASQRQDQLFHTDAELRSLHQIEDWAYETEDGSLATLPVLERMGVWDKAQSDSGNCMGRKCPMYSQCFYQAARRRMENGDLLVVNHALFFSDLALRAEGVGFLPPYDHVILDEAHTVEDVASNHFGLELTDSSVRFLLNALYNDRSRKGFLTSVSLKDAGNSKAIERAIQQVHTTAGAADRFFEGLVAWQQREGRRNGRVDRPEIVDNPLSPALNELVAALKSLMDQLKREDDQYELNAYVERARGQSQLISAWLQQSIEDAVFWIDISEGRFRRVTLAAAPIDVGPIMRRQLYNSTSSDGEPLGVVMTSATLATGRAADSGGSAATPSEDEDAPFEAGPNGSSEVGPSPNALPQRERSSLGGDDPFGYFTQRIGCEHAETLQLGSPFNYEQAVRLIIEPDLPDPSSREYAEAIGPRIFEHVTQTDGGAFVLFTSYAMLNRVASWLEPRLQDAGHLMLVQNRDGPRSVLLKRFRSDGRAVLLGTASFWAGVDVRGDALRNVIITKLPFAVPDRPLTEARIERIRQQGREPFVEYQLPEAVLRFKQGFGRLIRSRADTGRVVVLDRRIERKPYGRRFLEALPPVDVDRW